MRQGVSEDLLRALVPQALGTLLRDYGATQFDVCEDAVQEAVVQALQQWPTRPPRDPRAWLITASRRRVVDAMRSERARRAREQIAGYFTRSDGPARCIDDSLDVLALCCHPALTPTAQVVLTLRAVAGLTTAQIAHALLIPEPTAAQRISRAKATIRAAGGTFPPLTSPESRIDSILTVIYLTYTAGHTVTAGDTLDDRDLTAEAIRLARLMHAGFPEHAETTGLLALMLLTDARRDARTDGRGALVPLDEQDRSKWNSGPDRRGRETLYAKRCAAGLPAPTPCRRPSPRCTMRRRTPRTPTGRKSSSCTSFSSTNSRTPSRHSIARSPRPWLYGPAVGLRLIAQIEDDPALTRSHRLRAVRAHLLERVGDRERAREDYLAAARMTLNLPEQRYLRLRASRAAQASAG